MVQSGESSVATPASSLQRPLAGLGKRVGTMTLLWLLVGALVGAGIGSATGGTVAVAANAVAGMIVLPPLGGVLGLTGGQWRECLFGSVCGLGVGTLAGALEGQALAYASLCLLTGALIGGTFPGFFRFVRWGMALQTGLQMSGGR